MILAPLHDGYVSIDCERQEACESSFNAVFGRQQNMSEHQSDPANTNGLFEMLNRVRNDRAIVVANEAAICQGIVLPILGCLGWKPFDTSQVVPQFGVGEKRVDFCLCIQGTKKVFIEVKRGNEDLEGWFKIELMNRFENSDFVQGYPS